MIKVLKNKIDPRTAVVLLEGIRNVLDVGKNHFPDPNTGENPFVQIIEECGGIDVLEGMQEHPNQHVYDLAIKVLEQYFPLEDVDFSTQEFGEVKLDF